MKTVLSEKVNLENEIKLLTTKNSSLQNSVSAFVEDLLEDLRYANSGNKSLCLYYAILLVAFGYIRITLSIVSVCCQPKLLQMVLQHNIIPLYLFIIFSGFSAITTVFLDKYVFFFLSVLLFSLKYMIFVYLAYINRVLDACKR